jgi:hypothetical protein
MIEVSDNFLAEQLLIFALTVFSDILSLLKGIRFIRRFKTKTKTGSWFWTQSLQFIYT